MITELDLASEYSISEAFEAVRRDAGDVVLRFELPRGCYATSVLEELLKRPVS